MSTKERLSGIWLITMNLLALLAYTVFFVAQMWLDILHAWYLALVILQGTALFIYMWGPDKLKSKKLKVLYRLLFVSSFLVIPSFLFIFMGLISTSTSKLLYQYLSLIGTSSVASQVKSIAPISIIWKRGFLTRQKAVPVLCVVNSTLGFILLSSM